MASVAVLCYCRGYGNDLSNKAKYRILMMSVSVKYKITELKERNLTADLDFLCVIMTHSDCFFWGGAQ